MPDRRTVRIISSTRRHPFSYGIRFLNFSRWSHEGIIDGDHVIEALGSTGVRRVSLSAVLPEYLDYGMQEFKVPDHISQTQIDDAWAWLYEQIGKRYDWAAIAWQVLGRVLFLFGLERDWQQADRWFCFELRRAFLARLGILLERDDGMVQRATDCWGNPLGVVVTKPRLASA